MESGRTQVGVEAQILPDGEQSGLRALLGIGRVAPLGTAHRTQQNGVAGLAGLGGAVGVALAHRVNGAAAHEHVGVGKGVAELLAHLLQNLDGLPHYFGADAVAADESDFVIHFATPRAFKELSRPPLSMMPLMNSGKGAA